MRGISRTIAAESRTNSSGVEQTLFFVAIIAASALVMAVIGNNLESIVAELQYGLTC